MLCNFYACFLYDFVFKITCFKIFFQEYHLSVKQFGSRPGLTCQVCLSLVISGRHYVVDKELNVGVVLVKVICFKPQNIVEGVCGLSRLYCFKAGPTEAQIEVFFSSNYMYPLVVSPFLCFIIVC